MGQFPSGSLTSSPASATTRPGCSRYQAGPSISHIVATANNRQNFPASGSDDIPSAFTPARDSWSRREHMADDSTMDLTHSLAKRSLSILW